MRKNSLRELRIKVVRRRFLRGGCGEGVRCEVAVIFVTAGR